MMFRPEIDPRFTPKTYCGQHYWSEGAWRYCNKPLLHSGSCGYENRQEDHIERGEN